MALIVVGPDRAQQMLMGDDPAREARQLGDGGELLWGQMHLDAVACDPAAEQVDRDAPALSIVWPPSAMMRWRSAARTRASSSSVSKGLVT